MENIYNLNLIRTYNYCYKYLMDFFKNIERRDGVDMSFKKNIHPEDKKWRTGKAGLDKNLKLNNILEIAYSMDNPKPNIIIKAGKNAKWYLKYCSFDKIDEEIEKNKWRDASKCTMYIVTW